MEHQETDRDLKRKIEKLEEELLRARESARESEERYRALFDRSFYGVFIMDLEGRILDVNDIGLKMLGYRREHLGDLNFWNLISEDQAAAAAKARRRGAQDRPTGEHGGIPLQMPGWGPYLGGSHLNGNLPGTSICGAGHSPRHY